VPFLTFSPPVSGQNEGGNTFLPPGIFQSAGARLAVELTAGRAPYFFVISGAVEKQSENLY